MWLWRAKDWWNVCSISHVPFLLKKDEVSSKCKTDAGSHWRTLSGCHVENRLLSRHRQTVSMQCKQWLLFNHFLVLTFVGHSWYLLNFWKKDPMGKHLRWSGVPQVYHVIHGVLRKAPRSSSLNITLPLHLCDLAGILAIHKHSQDLGSF